MRTGPTHPRSAGTILAVATICQAASGYVFVGVAAVAGIIGDSLSLSGAETGLIVTAIAAAPLIVLIPVGNVLDRLGERRVVALGALWLAAGTGIAALSPSYIVLLAALLVAGGGYATSQPGGSKAIAGWFPGARRGLAMGIRQSGLPIGGALAAATLPAAAVAWGWRVALGLAAAVGISGAALFGATYSEPDHEADRVGYRVAGELRRLLGGRPLRPALVAGLVMVATQFCLVSYLIPFLRRDLGMSAGRAGFAVAGLQASGVAGRVVLASWSDRLGRGRRMIPVATAAVATMVGVGGLALVGRGWPHVAILGVAVALGFFAFGWYGPWVVHVTELAPARSVGLTLTFAMTANQIGIVAGPPLFGAVLDLSGSFYAAWLVLAAVLSVCVVVLLRARGRDRRADRAS